MLKNLIDGRAIAEQLISIPDGEERVLLATGRYIGEGFDDAFAQARGERAVQTALVRELVGDRAAEICGEVSTLEVLQFVFMGLTALAGGLGLYFVVAGSSASWSTTNCGARSPSVACATSTRRTRAGTSRSRGSTST